MISPFFVQWEVYDTVKHLWRSFFCENLIDFSLSKYSLKSVRIRSFSGPNFPAFELNTERYGVSLCIKSEYGENTDQKNSEYGQFSRSDYYSRM